HCPAKPQVPEEKRLSDRSATVAPGTVFRRDYIERLIQKLAEAIARALGRARSGETEEGLAVVEKAIASELGMPLAMLLKLTPRTIVNLLGEEKARLLAQALEARGEILKLAGRSDDAEESLATAAAVLVIAGTEPARDGRSDPQN
ncbi:MAG TPA: hypothetical protein VGK73_13325, partial [Polyangiaceae bacterium]